MFLGAHGVCVHLLIRPTARIGSRVRNICDSEHTSVPADALPVGGDEQARPLPRWSGSLDREHLDAVDIATTPAPAADRANINESTGSSLTSLLPSFLIPRVTSTEIRAFAPIHYSEAPPELASRGATASPHWAAMSGRSIRYAQSTAALQTMSEEKLGRVGADGCLHTSAAVAALPSSIVSACGALRWSWSL